MNTLNSEFTNKINRPIKFIQFGEGNFLRAFVDYMIDIANEKGALDGDIVIVKPIEYGNLEKFSNQNCQYTVQLRGIYNGKAQKINRVVTSVADAVDSYTEYTKYNEYAKLESLRYIISNTTEAGIVYDENDKFDLCPPKSFPGKLTKFLYTRYKTFNGDTEKGLIILPVELIDDNGIHLKECVLKQINNWNLEKDFADWINEACIFTSTLVDRIVTGYPKEEIEELWQEFGYRDELIVTGEPFALWVIESSKDISNELKLQEADLPIIFTTDHHPYKQRKVRILNGAHTSFVLASFLCGNDIVLESMKDELIAKYINKTLFDEIIPTLSLPKEECEHFAKEVLTRFNNPYVKHSHLSISLNSVSKWRARCLPSFIGYVEKYSMIPSHLAFSLAALMAFYTGYDIRNNVLIGHRCEQEYEIHDDKKVLEFFAAHSSMETEMYVNAVLSNKDFWGQNLCEIKDTSKIVTGYLTNIRTMGMRAAIKALDD